jgi:hemerythrin
MQVVWNNKYLVGIAELDEQHKNLMELIIDLELIQSNTKLIDYEQKIDVALTKINNYAVLHFSTEEVLMKMFEYELFEAHKYSHDKFLHILTEHHKYIMELMSKQKQVKDNKFEFDDIGQEINTRIAKVTTFLHKSFVHHMLKEDKEYTQFFIDIQKKAQKSTGWLSSLVGTK